MLTFTFIKQATTTALVAAARAESKPLTPLELELLDRIEPLLDEQAAKQPIAALLEEYEVVAHELEALLDSHPASLGDRATLLSLLNDEDIHEPSELKKLLGFTTKFRALANDAGDVFKRLNDLVTTNQE